MQSERAKLSHVLKVKKGEIGLTSHKNIFNLMLVRQQNDP